jgi:PAS domain S-box-containing protein
VTTPDRRTDAIALADKPDRTITDPVYNTHVTRPPKYLKRLLKSPDLRVIAFLVAGVAACGIVDGSRWKSLLTPTIAYRPGFLFGCALVFGWRGLIWSQLILLAAFTWFLPLRAAIPIDLLYMLSQTSAFVAARRLAGSEPWLSRERSTLALLAGAAMAPAIPALLDNAVVRLFGFRIAPGLPGALDSWLRGAAGVLAVAPALLVNGSGRLKEWVGFSPEHERQQPINVRNALELLVEVVAWSATLSITVHLKAYYSLNVTYLTLLPPVVFTLFRDMRMATLALAANAVVATTLWTAGHWSSALSAGDLRLLIAIYSMTSLILAAVVDERQRTRGRVEELLFVESVLREREKHFRTLANSAPVMMWMSGSDKLCAFVNKKWLDFAGRSFEHELGNGWASGLHPEDMVPFIAKYESSFHSRENFQAESRFRRADGEYRWMLVNGAPLYQEGQFAGYIGSCADITEQKIVAEQLRDSEAQLAYAQRLTKVGSFEWNVKNNSMLWSKEKLRMIGASRAPSDFEACLTHVHSSEKNAFLEIEKRVHDGNMPVEVEYRINRPEGDRVIRSIVDGIRNEKGTLERIVSASQDITDVRRAQEESFARQKRETLGTLANGIAHDFNNLLSAVIAQAELAFSELDSGGAPEEELYAIRDIAVEGSEIVRELMIYAGTESEAPVLLNISQVVEEMLKLLKISVSKQATIVTDLAGQLPVVLASPARISQLVMNLAMNASDALCDRDGVIRITTRHAAAEGGASKENALTEGDCVELEISDTGCGMLPETKASVLEPFFSTKSTGRGLGLAVVDGIVRRLGGSIRIESEPSVGTTVRISLPPARNDSRPIREEASRVAARSQLSHGVTVLLVEDEALLRRAASKMLGKSGIRAIEAADGSVALQIIRVHPEPIDVLVLDMTIPGASSWEVVEEARRLRPEMKVIVASAYSEEVARAALEFPVRRFLRKPYKTSELEELIRQTIS